MAIYLYKNIILHNARYGLLALRYYIYLFIFFLFCCCWLFCETTKLILDCKNHLTQTILCRALKRKICLNNIKAKTFATMQHTQTHTATLSFHTQHRYYKSSKLLSSLFYSFANKYPEQWITST